MPDTHQPKPICVRVLYGLFAPFILLWHSLDIYCFPCLWAYVSRGVCGVCCVVFSCFRCCLLYTDGRFPANHKSIGKVKYQDHEISSRSAMEEHVVWRRADEIMGTANQTLPAGDIEAGTPEKSLYDPDTDAPIKRGKVRLFEGIIEPKDVCQGNLGDCWLLSAFAALAEYPGAIQHVFQTKDKSSRGKYTVKFWDDPNHRWVSVSVDDRFPCDKVTGLPIFTKPNGGELWVMVLEKAFAKFCGSYHTLSGGHTLWALEAMTGDHVTRWKWKSEAVQWERFELKHVNPKKKSVKKRDVKLLKTADTRRQNKFFQLLKEYDSKGAIMAAASTGDDDQKQDQGIVKGHAYTILKVVDAEDNGRLVKLRNPWGTFEWTGDWSDTSDKWDLYPEIKKKCWGAEEGKVEDGAFWMEWADFMTFFHTVDICDRTVGVDDLHLNMYEDKGCIGPVKGCFEGCCGFWCCCLGLRRYYFPKRSKELKDDDGCCCCC
jgi:hypothetical protein